MASEVAGARGFGRKFSMSEEGRGQVMHDGDVRGRSRAPRDGFTAGPVMHYLIATRQLHQAKPSHIEQKPLAESCPSVLIRLLLAKPKTDRPQTYACKTQTSDR